MPAAKAEERRRAEQLVVGRDPLGDQVAHDLGGALDSRLVRASRARSRPGARTADSAAPGGARAPPRGSRPRRAARRGGCSAPPWRQRLDEDPSARLAAPAAAGELGDQREGALLGAEVGQPQRAVGVEDDAQGDVGEVVALGDHLGADQHARLGAARSGRGPRRGRRARRRCRSRAGRSRAGASISSSSASTRWVPDPTRAIVTEEHSGHDSGIGSAWPQWWQRRPPSRWRTSETSQCGHSQACPQERQVRWVDQPAPVDQQDRLAPLPRDLVERLAGPRVKRPWDRLRACRRSPPAAAAGRRRGCGSSSRSSSCQLSGRGVAVPQTSTAPASAARRRADLAGVVARVALLLVGGVVLLVDHDQAEIAHRREDGRARPDADPGLARSAGAATRRSARPPACAEWSSATRVAEAAPEAIHRLRGEGDLGDEHDRAAAAGERLPGGLQVDLGLARAGHAVEEEGRRGRPIARAESDATTVSSAVRWSAVSSMPSRTAPTPGDR